MFKKIIIFMLIMAFMFTLSSCKSKEEETDNITSEIPQEGNYTRYTEVEERIPHNIINAELVDYDEDKLFDESDLIFEGVVIDEKEIGLEEYINGRLRHTYYRDVFTFRVEKIFYTKNSSIKIGDVIKVANGSCSNYWIEGTIKMEKDKKYIVLTRKSRDTDTVEFSKYYDYAVVTHWMAIISVENGDYIFDEVFTSLKSSAKEEKIRKDGEFKTKMYKKGKEFETELENLISKKKKEN